MSGEQQPTTKQELIARLNDIMKTMSVDRLRALLDRLEIKPGRWQRRHDRRKCQLSVDYDTDSYSNRKDIRDLSAGGVYLETGDAFVLGQEISLWFSRPAENQQPVKISGRVVRRDAHGVGVRFESLNEQQRRMLLGEVSRVQGKKG